MDNATAFVHGGQMVVVDGLESLSQVSGMSIASIAELRRDCLDQLALLASRVGVPSIDSTLTIGIDSANFTIGGYSIPLGPLAHEPVTFSWDAPTTALNTMRVLRGCQLPKAILLEGSPGVGKTSLVSALAASTGHRLQRINLSDQTDLIDLFGSDLPVEGGNAGEFQWRDAAFLDAMQKGDWVLLDEMNLASQTVLEGLNAVLDHRGTVFIPELGRSFDRHPEFRIFAAQNPLQQGGGRKGLPKSFLNRFTKVYLQEHTSEDLTIICKALSSGIPPETVEKMIAFNEAIRTATMVTRHIGQEGSPWEFNLRDLARWFKLLSADSGTIVDRTDPVDYLRLAYLHRFRSQRDRDAVSEMFKSFFGVESPTLRPTAFLNHAIMQVGQASYERSLGSATVNRRIPHHHLEVAESILTCVEVGWLVILAGPSGGGKRAVVKSLAEQAGRPLGEFAMHPGVDTSEILGSFEQQDISRALNAAHATVVKVIYALLDKSVHIDASKVLAAHHKTTRSKTSLEAYLAAAHDFLALAAPHTDVKNAQAALVKLAKIDSDSTGFAWVDGQLLDAIRTGGWYLISDANLCNASVLDRLNSLCETNGTLVMSEKGSETGTPEIIRPHPDFRLFMTYDPRYGELSRAMRNRGAELFVSPNPDPVQLVNPAIADHGSFHHLFTRGKSLLPSSTAETISVVANALVVQEAEWIEDVERIYRVQTPPVPAIRDLISAVQRSGGGHYQFCVSLLFICSLAHSPQPIDESANPGLRPKTQNTMLRIAEMYFRNTSRLQHLEEWLAAPINAKSVLSVSAASVRRGPSRKGKAAGSDVYPFVQEMRLDLKEKIEYNILSDEVCWV
jgi:midasin